MGHLVTWGYLRRNAECKWEVCCHCCRAIWNQFSTSTNSFKCLWPSIKACYNVHLKFAATSGRQHMCVHVMWTTTAQLKSDTSFRICYQLHITQPSTYSVNFFSSGTVNTSSPIWQRCNLNVCALVRVLHFINTLQAAKYWWRSRLHHCHIDELALTVWPGFFKIPEFFWMLSR